MLHFFLVRICVVDTPGFTPTHSPSFPLTPGFTCKELCLMERKDKSNSEVQGAEELKVVFSMFVENTGSYLITLAEELEEIKIGNKVMKTLPKGRVYNLFADDSLDKGESIPKSLVRETGEIYASPKGDIYRLEWSV